MTQQPSAPPPIAPPRSSCIALGMLGVIFLLLMTVMESCVTDPSRRDGYVPPEVGEPG